MDFITGLPKTQGKDCIFVVVGHLTKFAHFLAISMDLNATQVADIGLQATWATQEYSE